MGGLVDPQDQSSWLSAAAVLTILLAIGFFGVIIYLVSSWTRMLATGGFRRLRHEWVSTAGDCQYSDCWRRVRYRLKMDPRPGIDQEQFMYVCATCADLHFPTRERVILTEPEVKAFERQQRQATREARIEKLERIRATDRTL